MPGDTLPMKLFRRQDRVKLQQALNAPAPYTRLIAMVSSCAVSCCFASLWHDCSNDNHGKNGESLAGV